MNIDAEDFIKEISRWNIRWDINSDNQVELYNGDSGALKHYKKLLLANPELSDAIRDMICRRRKPLNNPVAKAVYNCFAELGKELPHSRVVFGIHYAFPEKRMFPVGVQVMVKDAGIEISETELRQVLDELVQLKYLKCEQEKQGRNKFTYYSIMGSIAY